jgi:DNA polymerase I-like protein with 3'-5' exonuclease and polymerase domains
VLLGNTPLGALAFDFVANRYLSGETPKIMKRRGKDFLVKTKKGLEVPAMVTVHPAALTRNTKLAALFEEDITKVFWRRDKSYPDYTQRGENTTILDTVPKVRKYVKKLLRFGPKDVVCLDFETDGVQKLNAKILTVGFAHDLNTSYVVPYRHKESPWSGEEFREVRKLLIKLFKKFKFTLIAHHLKFEANVIQDVFGVSLHHKRVECTLLRTQILAENRGELKESGFKLKDLVEEWMQFYHYHDPDIAPIVDMRDRGRLASAPLQGVYEYNGMDCYAELRFYKLQDWIAKHRWGKAYLKRFRRYSRNLSGPASIFATQLERYGITANKRQLRHFMGEDSPIRKRMAELEQQLQQMETVQEANRIVLQKKGTIGGMKSLWDSDEDTGGVPWLFSLKNKKHRLILYIDLLKLKPVQTTNKGEPKVDTEFYKAHAGIPEVDIMREWAKYEKLRSTYVDGIYKRLQNDPDMRDGRVRGNLNLHKTVTGRTSFDNPNMQNIPRGKDEEAKAIKRLYTSGPGRILVCADYSQAEVRWMAQIAQDKGLIEQYQKVVAIQEEAVANPTPENAELMNTKGDYHTSTASNMFGKDPSEITKNERSAAKNVTFGNIYGMGIMRLSNTIGCSKKKAKKFQDKFFDQFPTASQWLQDIEKVGFRSGIVESPLGGRSRHLTSWFLLGDEYKRLKKKKFGTLSPGESILMGHKAFEDRASRNSPIQGVASDTNLLACVRLNQYCKDNDKDWWIINVVHDSIIADVPIDEVEEYMEVAREIMEDPGLFDPFNYKTQVPFKVDFSLGWNWGDQIDTSPVKTWKVKCGRKVKVEGERKKKPCPGGTHYGKKPKKCLKCNSKKVKVGLDAAPVGVVLKRLKKLDARTET